MLKLAFPIALFILSGNFLTAAEKPNVIIVFADDMGIDSVELMFSLIFGLAQRWLITDTALRYLRKKSFFHQVLVHHTQDSRIVL